MNKVFRINQNVAIKGRTGDIAPYSSGAITRAKLLSRGHNHVAQMKKYELYRLLEESFDCSGMCEKGLFYLTKPLRYGTPPRTCLKPYAQVLLSYT